MSEAVRGMVRAFYNLSKVRDRLTQDLHKLQESKMQTTIIDKDGKREVKL